MGSQLWSTAIHDYLNNNPHKFDEHGNFDPKPDPRDIWPFVLSGKYGKTPKPKGPRYSGMYAPHQGPDDVAQQRNLYAAQDFAKGIRYDEEKCYDNWQVEQKLCRDGKYSPGCWERANERHNKCKSLKHYDGLPIWTYQDETGQPQGDEDPDRRKKPTQSANPKPEDGADKSKRAISPTEMFLMTHPLLSAYLAANPEAARILHDMPAHMHALLRRTTLVRSDFPKGMERLTNYSPPPNLGLALGGPMGPRGLPVGGY